MVTAGTENNKNDVFLITAFLKLNDKSMARLNKPFIFEIDSKFSLSLAYCLNHNPKGSLESVSTLSFSTNTFV